MDKFEVILVSHALKFYKKCPVRFARRLNSCFEELENNPLVGRHIKMLHAESKLYRYRLGDYRVIYSVDKRERKIIVSLIASRQSAYREL